MRMTGNEDSNIWKFRGQRLHRVGKIVPAGARFESHVASHQNGVRAVSLCLRNCPTHRLNGMWKLKSRRQLLRKPERHAWGGDADYRDLNSQDFLHNQWLNVGHWMFSILKFAHRCTFE